jgi:hypothetical protein
MPGLPSTACVSTMELRNGPRIAKPQHRRPTQTSKQGESNPFTCREFICMVNHDRPDIYIYTESRSQDKVAGSQRVHAKQREVGHSKP